jgi:integrase
MHRVNQAISVLTGGVPSPSRRQPPILTAYEHFRLDRQGMLVSPRTLEYYDGMVLPFLRWVEADGVHRFEALDVSRLRVYRAQLATRPGRRHGQPLQPKTILESHRAILCFLRWARREGYHVDARILELSAPRVPDKEPTVYHIAQVRKVLAACNPAVPTEDLVVRILVGSGLRRAEICGLAVLGPDGLSDVMTDSLGRGRVELRVRWDAGAKGRKSRRVAITPKLAAAIKRYEARHRPETDLSQLLIWARRAVPGAGDQVDDGPAHGAGRIPGACPRVQAHVRDGCGKAGLEFRTPPGGDGSLGLRNAAAVRSARDRARPGTESRLAGADR